jgi:hypothetical protein
MTRDATSRSITSPVRAHSGNPAFRRPRCRLAFDCPPHAIHPDIVKAGSTSSTPAAASCAFLLEG